ncbi:MAG: PAS domain S-box protein [Phenylobacterium sp.]|nr:PAS domain S-box protein [Phenylobacterium sp.]MDP3748822.1 PAS domain S-box protein [Phenylobacterium sp.]
MLETALDGVIVMGVDGVVIDWNHQAEAIFGWRRDDAVGRILAELIIPESYRDAHRAGLDRFLTTGEGPLLRRRVEVSSIRRSGEAFPIELSISPVEVEGSTLFLGFVRDISERRRNEDLLKRQVREAELLHHVTSVAAETQSLDEILQLCLDSVCELTGWPAGHAYLPQRGDPLRLIPTAIWHGDLDQFAQLRAATEASTFKAGDGLPGRIWRTREPEWIADIRQHGAFPRAIVRRTLGVDHPGSVTWASPCTVRRLRPAARYRTGTCGRAGTCRRPCAGPIRRPGRGASYWWLRIRTRRMASSSSGQRTASTPTRRRFARVSAQTKRAFAKPPTTLASRVTTARSLQLNTACTTITSSWPRWTFRNSWFPATPRPVMSGRRPILI